MPYHPSNSLVCASYRLLRVPCRAFDPELGGKFTVFTNCIKIVHFLSNPSVLLRRVWNANQKDSPTKLIREVYSFGDLSSLYSKENCPLFLGLNLKFVEHPRHFSRIRGFPKALFVLVYLLQYCLLTPNTLHRVHQFVGREYKKYPVWDYLC